MTIKFSVFTSESPARLTKTYRRNGNGAGLEKEPGGAMLAGFVRSVSCADLGAVLDELEKLGTNQAVSWGVCEHERARVVTKSELPKIKSYTDKSGQIPVIARDSEHFSWPSGAAVFFADNDPAAGAPTISPDELHSIMCGLFPGFVSAPMAIRHTSSSWLYNEETGEELRGAGGLRVLIPILDGTDIVRSADVLIKRCWLAGLGRIDISKSGALLPRTIFDGSIYQKNRLDFVSGAFCVSPVCQRRPAPTVYNLLAAFVDSRKVFAPLSLAEEAEYEKLLAEAKLVAKDRARAQQEIWVAERVALEISKLPEDTAPVRRDAIAKKLTERFRQAISQQILLGDFPLVTENGEPVTVGEILDDPDKWHGTKFHDPIEPDYPDTDVARVNLRAAGKPYIWSFAHGGRRFNLVRARKTIEVVPGERVAIVRKVAELARIAGNLYERGKDLVKVDPSGEINIFGLEKVLFYLDGLARWEKYDGRSDKMKAIDVPKAYATGLMSDDDRGLPRLEGVSIAPFFDLPSGRLVEKDGYDEKTEILLLLKEEFPEIPSKPNTKQAEDALKKIWEPFAKFPFCGPVDRAVHLANIFSTVQRLALPTAPATLYCAPSPASGKTLLALSVSELSNTKAFMLPTISGLDSEDEIRKSLTAFSRVGSQYLILDNLSGVVKSDVLSSFLSGDDAFCGRVLGVSEIVKVSTRTSLVLTGNNVTLGGVDINRRVLTCRIDPGTDAPWKRRFSIEPRLYCREKRSEIISACLTLIRFAVQNYPAPRDRTGSFEVWSDTIRRTVCATGLLDTEGVTFVDPIGAIDKSYSHDPETQKLDAFLQSVFAAKKQDRWNVPEILALARAEIPPAALWDSCYELAGDRGRDTLNPRIMGRWLERNQDVVVSGDSGRLKITRENRASGKQNWSISAVLP